MLQRIETAHFKSMMDSREPPKKMIDLLNEYIEEHHVQDEYDPLTVLKELKAAEEKEMKMNMSAGEYNPYR